MRPSRGSLACIAASVLAGLVYLNALHNPFIYDDHRTIIDNGSLVDLSDLRAIVAHDVTRPLVNLSYAIDRRVWGPEPFGFHATSILLHVLNVCLLFQLARRMADDRNRQRGASSVRSLHPEVTAFAAAALFAVHPLMTQAVGYISGRSEVLCASFFLAALLSGRRWLLAGGTSWWLMTWALWMAALLTKETAVMLPFVLLCLDRLILAGTPAEQCRRLWRLHLPLLAVAVAGAIGRVAVFVMFEQPVGEGAQFLSALDAVNVLWRYAFLVILPIGQSIFHVIVPAKSVFEPRVLASIAGLLAVLAIVWQARRRTPIISVGVMWFLLLLLPSSALMVMDSSGDMSEHRAYLASAGPFLMAGAFFGWLADTKDAEGTPVRWIAVLLMPAALLSLSGRTLLRNAMWSSPVMTWSEAVAYAPDHWMPRTVLGEALHDAGRHEEAVAAHRQALAGNPDEESIYLKLGYCLAELNRFDEAKATFETLRARHPQSRTAVNGLGIVAMMSGQSDIARARFQEAIALDANDVTARQWLAVLEERGGNPAEALRLCEEIQRLAPVSLGNEECVRRNRETLGR